jgi:hypothetical protein
MTALDKFERLESLGLWKETASSQKKEVIVSFGKASLVLSDNKDTPLTHWALSALEINSVEDDHFIYAPSKDGFETLEISDPTMNRAIGKVRKQISKPKSHRGRIRLMSAGVVVLCLSLLATLWLPDALADYTMRAVNGAKAREIGAKLMPHINQYAGRPCSSFAATPVVRKLEDRLLGTDDNTLFISDLGARYSTHLPGGIILANRVLVEDYTQAEVLAGFVLMEKALQERNPALRSLFRQAGSIATLSFLVTGHIEETVLANFAKHLMTAPLVRPDTKSILALFQVANIPSTPFAKALDNQLITTKVLVDNNPVKGTYRPLLTDPQWLALQSICEN